MYKQLQGALPCLLAAHSLAVGVFPTRAQEPPADAFVYAAPTGWKPERIPFPLGFAPSLSYKGFEQLHFAPGIFDPNSDNYFTSLFFWWVEGEPQVTEETLARELTEYYRRLCAAVGGPKKLNLDLTKVDATVNAVDDGKSSPTSTRRFTGRLNTFDPFNTGEALALQVEITTRRCDSENRTVVFFWSRPADGYRAVGSHASCARVVSV
ncbi:MAG: hypothetical protein IPF53_12625 [Blastocatellia bacterium]|nr:hypothetical protein [Blastocatellia bacterium]